MRPIRTSTMDVAAAAPRPYAVLRSLPQTVALAFCVGAALALAGLGVFVASWESHRVLITVLMSFLGFALFATLSALLLRSRSPARGGGTH